MNNQRLLDVLLVEDSPTDVLLTEEALDEPQLFRLTSASNLRDGLTMLSGRHFDVVLLDLSLPDSQGLATLQRLLKQRPFTSVIVLTGNEDDELAMRAVHEGAQDYLIKNQIQGGSLRRAIRYAIERSHSREMLQERVALSALTVDVVNSLIRPGTLPQLLQACAQALVDNLHAAFARIWTLDTAQSVLQLQASAGLYTHLDGAHSRIAVGQFKIGRIAETRRPHLSNDVLHDSQVSDPDWARREKITAFAGFPLLIDDAVVGVMALFARQPLQRPTLDAMGAVASQIALGIERKRTQESLQATQDRLHEVLAASPAIIYSLKLDGAKVIEAWNSDNVETLLGYDPQHTGPDWWWDNVHPDDRADAATQIARLVDQGRLVSEYRFRHRNGSYRWIRDEKRLLVDKAGRPRECVGSWTDITERKQLEEQFRQAQKMEAIGQLAGGVAHDFNNLLTVINGYGEIVAKFPGVDDATRKLLGEIVKAGERAASLTRQLLAFSRKQVLDSRILNLNSIIADLEKMLRRLIGEDVKLHTRLAKDLGAIKADAGQIEQVIMNLVVNARDAMPQGGTLTIETVNSALDENLASSSEVRPGPYVLLTISDTGCGMDESIRSHIFEPFFTTKGPGKGTGLGLATAYGIIKQCGGHIAVASEPGRGATFKIYLPMESSPPTSGKGGEHPRAVTGTETLLLVEDEPAVRALSSFVLQSAGFRVLEADNGEEALRICQSHPGVIHLLVTDVVMPGMSGRQLVEKLARLKPQIKVLYVSGYTDDAVVRHGVLEEGLAFLQKPFTPAGLAQKVRAVLDAS